jgi:Tol biopolymer transport system component
MRFFLFLVSVLVSVTSAQTVQVVDMIELTSPQDGIFYFPQFSPDGGKVIFSSSAYHGLLYYDLNKKQIIRINSYQGAGYEPVFSSDGNKVFFRIDRYEKGKKITSIGEYNFKTNSHRIVAENQRNMSIVELSQSGNLILRHGNIIETVQLNGGVKKNENQAYDPLVYAKGKALFLEQNGNIKEIVPVGNRNYIWPSLSPDKSRILFTVAGKGTYICDFNGNIKTELGYANAPQWSPDGKWILYMHDTDDGQRYLSSDIYIVTADGNQRIKLTDSQRIYMYPQWSPDMRQIVFHSEEGQIYLLKLQIN